MLLLCKCPGAALPNIIQQYNVISHISSYYFKMFCATETTKFSYHMNFHQVFNSAFCHLQIVIVLLRGFPESACHQQQVRMLVFKKNGLSHRPMERTGTLGHRLLTSLLK